jgi:predicted nucleic acid-binding protein
LTIRVVLDTSALLAYLSVDTRSVAVGELLLTVAEDGGVTAIPALSLLAAYRQIRATDHVRLRELSESDHGAAVILPLLAQHIYPVAELSIHLPERDAHTVVAVREHAAILATCDRRPFKSVLAEDDILEL